MRRKPNLNQAVLWALMEAVISIPSALATIVIVARIIGPEQFGLAAMAALLGSLAELMIAAPFVEAIVQRRKLDVRDIDAAFAGILITGTFMFMALCISAFVLSDVYDSPLLGQLLLVQATTCLMTAVRIIPEAVLTKKFRFKAISIRTMSAKTVSALVSIGLALAGWGAFSVVIGNVAFALVSLALVWKAVARKPKPRFDRQRLVQLLGFGIYTLLDTTLWNATPRLFTLVVGYFQGPTIVGYLSVGFRLVETLSILINSVTVRMALPYFSIIADQPEQVEAAYRRATHLTFLISAPAFIGMAVTSSALIEVFLGREWLPASGAVIAASVTGTFIFARGIASPVIKAVGLPSILVLHQSVSITVALTGAVIASRFNLQAIFIAWAAYGVFLFLAGLPILRIATRIGLSSQIRPLAKPAFASATMAMAVLPVLQMSAAFPPWVQLAVSVLIGGIAYTVTIGIIDSEARALLRHLNGPIRKLYAS